MAGLQLHAANFFIFFTALCTCGIVATSLFTFFGAVVRDIKVAQILAPISVTLFALVAYVSACLLVCLCPLKCSLALLKGDSM
jgi:hypothetical protein